MRHLNLATKIGAVDEVAGVISAGKEGNRTAKSQVHTDTHFPVIKMGHPRFGKTGLASEDRSGSDDGNSHPSQSAGDAATRSGEGREVVHSQGKGHAPKR
jgi:hypothetical protein